MSEPTLLIVGRRGRPSRAGRVADQRIEFYVTDDEKAHLKRVAATERKGLATVIREAVNEFVADYGERPVFSSGRKS